MHKVLVIASQIYPGGFAYQATLHAWTTIHQVDQSTLLRHPIGQTVTTWFRNINRIPIAYAFRPRLRGRLTLGGRTLPRKP